MTTAQQPRGTWVDWLIDRLLRGFFWLLMLVPYRRRVPLMGWLTMHILAPVAGYRRRAEDNLRLIYPDMPPVQRRTLANAACDNFGRTLIENYSWRAFSTHLADVAPEGPGLKALEQAKAEGRPVIFVTGHFGNHEAPRHVLTRMGYTIGGLYRPMANPYFNAHYASTMTAWGGPVFAQGRRGTVGFAKHLRAGGMATLLFDVANSGGVPIPFLGQPAMTATSVADLALRSDAVVIPYFGIRQPDGLRFRVLLEQPVAHQDPIAMMQEVTQRLEAQIAENPHLWFWVHRRWKMRNKSRN